MERTFGRILLLVGFQGLNGLHERLATFTGRPGKGGLATEVFRITWWLRHRLRPVVVVIAANVAQSQVLTMTIGWMFLQASLAEDFSFPVVMGKEKSSAKLAANAGANQLRVCAVGTRTGTCTPGNHTGGQFLYVELRSRVNSTSQ